MHVLNMAEYGVNVCVSGPNHSSCYCNDSEQTWVGPQETICYVAKPVSKDQEEFVSLSQDQK